MKEIKVRFFRYFITGGAAAIVDVSFFAAFIHFGLEVWEAACISFVVAMAINFLATATFVFNQKVTVAKSIKFTVGAIFGLVINASVTSIAFQNFLFVPVLAKVMGIGVAFIFNFIINMVIVFPKSRSLK